MRIAWKFNQRLSKKYLVRENPDHAPKMINGRPLKPVYAVDGMREGLDRVLKLELTYDII